MSLVNCPECNASISARAQSCPHCGNPMRPTVVESTGKVWKVLVLLGWLTVLPGAYLVVRGLGNRGWFDPTTGLGIMIASVGIAALIVGRFGSWWNHR